MLYLLTSGRYSGTSIGELIEAPEGLTSEDWKDYDSDLQGLYDAASRKRHADIDVWLQSQGYTNDWGELVSKPMAKMTFSERKLVLECYDLFPSRLIIDRDTILKPRGWKLVKYMEVHDGHPVPQD